MSIYSDFCKFSISYFFPSEKKGDHVFLIVDDNFIDKACNNLNVTRNEIYSAVKSKYYSYNTTITLENAIGMIILQIYAAYNRESNDEINVAAYYPRLSDILKLEESYLKNWMSNCQNAFWKILYKWCNSHDFEIEERAPRYYAYCYVQYPLSQVLLNKEDLKHFANIFHESSLLPNENLSYKDFRSIISNFNRYSVTPNCRRILEDNEKSRLGWIQIYYYYQYWNGIYYDYRNSIKEPTDAENNKYKIFISNDFNCIYVCDLNLNKICEIKLIRGFESKLKIYYRNKYSDVILFKKDELYDAWEETRFLQENESGILLFLHEIPYWQIRSLEILFQRDSYSIVKINIDKYSKYYASEKIYNLEGGLRIEKDTYLLGAAPLLKIKSPSVFWIDDKKYVSEGFNVTWELDLDCGDHTLKFPNLRKIDIKIKSNFSTKPIWKSSYKNWLFSNGETPSWQPSQNGCCRGLDFSQLAISKIEIPALKAWIFGLNEKKYRSKNSSVKQINNS